MINVLKVNEAIIKDQIPGMKFKEVKCQGAKKCQRVTKEERKLTQELRMLAFNFPKKLPARPPKVDKPQNEKSKKPNSQTRDPHDNWGKESVDYRVMRVLMRCRVLKQERKERKAAPKSGERIKAGKPLGKFGRGELPHEFCEEERKLRDKKRKERLAKEKKDSFGCPQEEQRLPSSGGPDTQQALMALDSNKMIKHSPIKHIIGKLVDDLISDIISKQAKQGSSIMLTDGEEEEEDVSSSEEEKRLPGSDSPAAKPDLKDLGSNPLIINNVISDVTSKQPKESFPSKIDGSSSEEEEEENDGASEGDTVPTCSGSQDLGVNKMEHFYNKPKKEVPCLTSDSENDAGEGEKMSEVHSSYDKSEKVWVRKRTRENVKDRGSKYIKDWGSNKVFKYNKDQKALHLESDLDLIADDSDYQYGDDESEEEKEKKKQRRKFLPRGRGGASQWEQLAEEERLRNVAIMRENMVQIAAQVHTAHSYLA